MTNVYAPPKANLNTTPEQTKFDKSSSFSLQGRFTRLSYLAWCFLAYLFMVMLVLLSSLFIESIDTLAIPIGLFLMIFLWVFSVRRLHDINLSGWWSLLNLIPLINIIFGIFLVVKKGSNQANKFARPRQTRKWEKVLGIIAIILFIAYICFAIVGIGSYLLDDHLSDIIKELL